MNFIEWKKRQMGFAADISLSEHDKKYHPGGYKQGDKCRLRETEKKIDEADKKDIDATEGHAKVQPLPFNDPDVQEAISCWEEDEDHEEILRKDVETALRKMAEQGKTLDLEDPDSTDLFENLSIDAAYERVSEQERQRYKSYMERYKAH